MHFNTAYLNNSINVVKDLTKPLLITSCGYYRIDSGPCIKTNRPKGRRDYQLIYIAEGKAYFFFNKTERILTKGETVLFRPYEQQSYFYYPEDKCEAYWVHFTGGEVEEILNSYTLPSAQIFYSGTSPDYPWLFNQMIRELQLCRTNYEEVLTLLLKHIFLLIGRYLKEKSDLGARSLDEIERSIRYFNEHYKEEINVEEYAKSLHMSTCWFNRRFKQITKVTPLQYIIAVRLANAKTLLETKGYNVSETANAVGYDNPLYFSRLFTKHVGISPSEYKKLHL